MMVRDTSWQWWIGAGLCLALAGCGMQLDRVDLRLSEQLTADTKIIITKPIDENDDDDTVMKDNDELVGKIEKCTSAHGSWAEKGKDDAHRSVFRFKLTGIPASEMNDFLECFGADVYELRYSKKDGLLWDTYYLTIAIAVGAPIQNEKLSSTDDRWAELPRKISIAMPGGDLKVEDLSARKALTFSTERVSDAEAMVILTPLEARMDEAAKIRRDCERPASKANPLCQENDNARWPNAIPVKLQFSSIKYRYGFDQIMAVLGLLFGSGLILGARTLLSRPRKIDDHS